MKVIDVDSFAGGGGASLGIEMALGKAVDIAINHDSDAIAMHSRNHPFCKHYERMLTPRELFRAQGFPDGYLIEGMTKEAQVRMAGNSVCPPMAAALVSANLQTEIQIPDKYKRMVECASCGAGDHLGKDCMR